jgi:hypothetical protein
LATEPYAVVGGPFDLRVRRVGNVISMIVNGDKGDLVTQIDFNAAKIDNVIAALISVRGNEEDRTD